MLALKIKMETYEHKQQSGSWQKEGSGRRRGSWYDVTEDLTLGGGHTVPYTDLVTETHT